MHWFYIEVFFFYMKTVFWLVQLHQEFYLNGNWTARKLFFFKVIFVFSSVFFGWTKKMLDYFKQAWFY